jgi:voltage-gated sodium channel
MPSGYTGMVLHTFLYMCISNPAYLHLKQHIMMFKRLFLDDRIILGVILLNALVIFVQAFDPPHIYYRWLEMVDNTITLLFLIEATVKLRTWGKKQYFASAWNVFDFVLVVLAMPAFIAYTTGYHTISLDFLLAFRIMRVFKFFRFIRFIPQIDHIIAGVGRAARASIVIVFAFFIFNFTVSLISCFLFRNTAPEFFCRSTHLAVLYLQDLHCGGVV